MRVRRARAAVYHGKPKESARRNNAPKWGVVARDEVPGSGVVRVTVNGAKTSRQFYSIIWEPIPSSTQASVESPA